MWTGLSQSQTESNNYASSLTLLTLSWLLLSITCNSFFAGARTEQPIFPLCSPPCPTSQATYLPYGDAFSVIGLGLELVKRLLLAFPEVELIPNVLSYASFDAVSVREDWLHFGPCSVFRIVPQFPSLRIGGCDQDNSWWNPCRLALNKHADSGTRFVNNWIALKYKCNRPQGQMWGNTVG